MIPRFPLPWRNWYHCMGNTRGTWLPGDPKGFRTRHHKHHVEGDYQFPPPPGYYDALFERSRKLMPTDAVFIPRELRPLVCQHFMDALQHHHVQVVELSMGGVHWHLIARFVPVGIDPHDHLRALGITLTHTPHHESPPPPNESPPPPGVGSSMSGSSPRKPRSAYDHDPAPRRLLGLARSYLTHQLKRNGHFPTAPGGLWALRPKCEPIANRAHQLAAVHYIRRHAQQGGAVWSMLGNP